MFFFSNKNKGVPIMLDKRRHLRFDLEAFARIEKDAGISLRDLTKKWKPRTMAVLIWGALIHEDPDLTIEKVQAMVGEAMLDGRGLAIVKATNEAYKRFLKNLT